MSKKIKYTYTLDGFKLTNEEYEHVKFAINSEYPNVDLQRGKKRITLNLRNYKELKEI